MIPRRDHSDGIGYLYLGGAASILGLIVGLSMVTRLLGPASIPIWGVSLLAVILIANGPIGKAIGRRISGELAPNELPAQLPEELYAELDEMRARMIEMEERQDFAERLLAAQPDQARTSTGGDA